MCICTLDLTTHAGILYIAIYVYTAIAYTIYAIVCVD